jgi:intraflagellar transport protein 81
MDLKKLTKQNLSSEKMLDNLRVETRKNRELNNEVIGRELNDKRERLQRTEMLLQEPVTTQSELERLTNDTKRLQRDCMTLEEKLKMNTPADEKKDLKQQDIKKLDVEKQALEKQMLDKESEYQRTKGGKYMKRDDFKQYAANLRGKNTEYKKKK